MEEKNLWHTKSIEQCLDTLHSSPLGLSEEEAKLRLEKFGPNTIREAKPDSFLKHLIRQFESPLVYILLIAAIIVILTGDLIDGIIIAAVLAVNAVVGAFQEGRAANTLAALKTFLTTTATVLRNGQEKQQEDSALVPGDVVIVREGEKIPADSRILETSGLMVSESSITGESIPVEKTPTPLKNPLALPAEQKNMLFKGTLVTRGSAKALVVATGLNSFIGHISEKVASVKKEIPLQTHLRELANILIIVVLLLSIAIFVVGVGRGISYAEMFGTVVALAVSVIPEGLPIAVTLILAGGVYRMGKRRALVKKLQAVEALSHVDVVAVDKTGTITKNELTAVKIWTDKTLYTFTGLGYDPQGSLLKNNKQVDSSDAPGLKLAGMVFALSSNATIYKNENNDWVVKGDPIEASLIVAAKKLGFSRESLLESYALVEEISFDYKRRFHATVHQKGKKFFMSAVGATEAILDLCPGVKKALVLNKEKTLSAQGLRVLAYAFQDNAKLLHGSQDKPSFTFGGLVALEDQMQPGVGEAVLQLQHAGIKVIMLSGDNPVTAHSIALQSGIAQADSKVITGKELAEMKEIKGLEEVSVFARVTPEDKLKIVESFGKIHKTIAMTGDGVNDAPALVAADLGLAMGKNGTEVAKEASDIVLLDDNFSNIIAAVEEGRSMYLSIKKVLMYLFSTSLAELFAICFAIFIGLPLPLQAVQILWLNLVTDGFITIALGFEPKEKNLLGSAFRKPSRYILDGKSVVRILIVGSTMGFVSLWMFLTFDGTLAEKQTIALVSLAVVQWMNAFTARAEQGVFQTNPFSNKWLLLAVFTVIVLQVGAVYLPFMQTILGTVNISPSELVRIIIASLLVLLADEAFKRGHKLFTIFKNRK